MKLFGYYRSSATYRVRIILNAKKIDWEYVPVALDKGEQLLAEHSQRNPMKLVPVLDTGEGLLAQSTAIAEYLEYRFPAPPLLPLEEVDRARVRDMVQIIASETQPVQNLRVLKYLRTTYGEDDEGVANWARHWIGEGLRAYEQRAAEFSSDGSYSFGDRLTIADAFLIPQVYNAERFQLDLSSLPTISTIVAHCRELEPVAAAHPSRQPDAPENA